MKYNNESSRARLARHSLWAFITITLGTFLILMLFKQKFKYKNITIRYALVTH